MNAPGHLAAAYFLARRGEMMRIRGALLPTALGALIPDIVDKAVYWLDLSPYGRTVGHSLLLWMCALGLGLSTIGRLGTRSWPAWLVLGGFSHLAVDLIDDVVEGFERTGYVFSAWFGWPLTNPDMGYVQVPHLLERMPHATTPLELATVTACVWHALLMPGRDKT